MASKVVCRDLIEPRFLLLCPPILRNLGPVVLAKLAEKELGLFALFSEHVGSWLLTPDIVADAGHPGCAKMTSCKGPSGRGGLAHAPLVGGHTHLPFGKSMATQTAAVDGWQLHIHGAVTWL